MASISALNTVALCGGQLPSWFVAILIVAVLASFFSILSFLFNFIFKFSESDKKEVPEHNDKIDVDVSTNKK